MTDNILSFDRLLQSPYIDINHTRNLQWRKNIPNTSIFVVVDYNEYLLFFVFFLFSLFPFFFFFPFDFVFLFVTNISPIKFNQRKGVRVRHVSRTKRLKGVRTSNLVSSYLDECTYFKYVTLRMYVYTHTYILYYVHSA